MRVPPEATPSVQAAFRELQRQLDVLKGGTHQQNANIKGRRVTNAGDAKQEGDYVTLRQLSQAMSDISVRLSNGSLVLGTGSGTGGGGTTPPPACDDHRPDYTAAVTLAKSQLVFLGTDLTGPCGAFEITKLAVWLIQADDATVGLLEKTSGENCGGYATAIAAFAEGAHYDILIDAGGLNTPTWSFKGCIDPASWRPPIQV